MWKVMNLNRYYFSFANPWWISQSPFCLHMFGNVSRRVFCIPFWGTEVRLTVLQILPLALLKMGVTFAFLQFQSPHPFNDNWRWLHKNTSMHATSCHVLWNCTFPIFQMFLNLIPHRWVFSLAWGPENAEDQSYHWKPIRKKSLCTLAHQPCPLPGGPCPIHQWPIPSLAFVLLPIYP